eukprot:442509-Rhodomonas_salina.2
MTAARPAISHCEADVLGRCCQAGIHHLAADISARRVFRPHAAASLRRLRRAHRKHSSRVSDGHAPVRRRQHRWCGTTMLMGRARRIR